MIDREFILPAMLLAGILIFSLGAILYYLPDPTEPTYYCPMWEPPCELVEEWIPELDKYITYCLITNEIDLTLTTGEDNEPK